MEDVRVLRVTTTVDEFDRGASEGTGLSLREAIAIANQSASDEIIELESGQVYQIGTELDIASTGGMLTIRTLDGTATIDGNETSRVLHVNSDGNGNGANLALGNLTITGGRTFTSVTGDSDGAGILIDDGATATLSNCNITGNVATDSDDKGGGIFNDGILTLTNCVVSNNSAGEGGGIQTSDGLTTIFDSTITNNSVSDFINENRDISVGGGISHRGSGSTIVDNSTISNNTAGSAGGGLSMGDLSGSEDGSLTIVDSIISGNQAPLGGGISSRVGSNATIENTVIENNVASSGGGVFVASGADDSGMNLIDSTIRNNRAYDGGGIYADNDLRIKNSTISGNNANGDGGGIKVRYDYVRIDDSVIDGNNANGDGGGVQDVDVIIGSTISNNTAGGNGGGVASSLALILNSTISGNSAGGDGGGIRTAGGLLSYYVVAIANSTITGNSAGGDGGGIDIVGGLDRFVGIEPDDGIRELFNSGVVANNVTITNNIADSDNNGEGNGGGIYNPSFFDAGTAQIIPGKLELSNSILEGNFDTPENSGEGSINPDISGPARGNANNLVGNLDGLTIAEFFVATEEESLGQGSDITGVDPRLGELQNNGSNIATYALLPGSPAINAGSNEGILQETFVDINGNGELTTFDFNNDGDFDDALESDQRGEGFARIFGDTVDIGAFEVQEELPLPEDNPPTVVTPIDDLSFSQNIEDQTIDLSNVFGDADDDEIAIALLSNSNDELVAATVEENNLILDFAENTSGTAEITLRATANRQSVDDTFSVTVESDDEPSARTIELFRFRNKTFNTGTYIFVGEAERDFILNDENLSNIFSLDGVAEDGTVNPAFTANTVNGEGLIPFFRLESLSTPGTFVFVSTDEYDAIFAEDSNQSEQWKKQGFADEAQTQDIPEFYLRDGSADSGVVFNRFQNQENGTFLYAGGAEIDAIEDNPDLKSLFKNQGVAFKSM